jgi:transcriptional/translational regulatory protein YebC/TACO1
VADVETARTVLGLMEALDDYEDVQNVSASFTIPEWASPAL